MQIDAVTRMEIVEAIDSAFSTGGADRSEILAAAATNSARTQVVAVLNGLPNRRFRVMNELWEELGHVPVS